MIGNVIKIHSDFYYARVENNILECKIREKLKKEKKEVFVGDLVQLDEINLESKQAVITEVLERKNYILRPSVANIDQIIVVAALNQPSLDFTQLDRYLAQAKLYNIPAVICINKSDLEDKKHSKRDIISVYEPLGYEILFTCALTGKGIDKLKDVLASKISVLSGTSGVGKSSLLNRLQPGLGLKTKKVSAKTQRGTHATRHVEILDIDLGKGSKGEIAQVADTPGFSYLKFDTVLPGTIEDFFDEIKEFGRECYYNDCLHLEEDNCNVLANLDKIAFSRYKSYKTFVNEALEYKEKLAQTGHKKEKKVKTKDTRDEEKTKIIRLGKQAREKSRKNKKQKLNFISSIDDAYYNNEDDLD